MRPTVEIDHAECIRKVVEKTVVLPYDFSHTDVILIDPEHKLYRVNVRRKDYTSRNSLVDLSFVCEITPDGYAFNPQLDAPRRKNKFETT